MIVVSAVLEAQTGKEKDMESAFRNFMPKVQSEEGTIAYILHRSKGNLSLIHI